MLTLTQKKKLSKMILRLPSQERLAESHLEDDETVSYLKYFYALLIFTLIVFPVWSRMKLCFHVIVASKKKSRARCKWGKWRTSSCSRSCGGGVYTRTRSRVSLRRGTICKGLERVQRRCNRKKCPIKKPSKKYFLNLYIWIEISITTIWMHVIRMF